MTEVPESSISLAKPISSPWETLWRSCRSSAWSKSSMALSIHSRAFGSGTLRWSGASDAEGW